MKRRYLPCVAALLGLLAVGCGDSESAQSGATEPMTASNGQFYSGSFPSDQGGPAVTSTSGYRTTIIPAGTVAKGIGGDAAPGSLAIAVAMRNFSSGYWIVPVGSPDQDTMGELSWKATLNFSRDLAPGDKDLLFAASNHDGVFGPTRVLAVTTLPLIPEGHVVASLSWGNDADVDFHLTGPSGKELDPKHISTTDIDDSTKLPLPGAGTLDRDSLANCVPDGRRMENVVWPSDATEPPEAGVYTVRADLFSACGRPSTTFVFDLYIDGAVVQHQAGILLDTDADNGGLGSGLYVTQFTL